MKHIAWLLGSALAVVGGASGQSIAADLARAPVLDSTAVIDTSVVNSDWYVSAQVGVALPGTISVTSAGGGPFAVPGLSGNATFRPGFAGAVAVGRFFSDGIRAELALGASNNEAESFNGNFAGGFGPIVGAMTGSVTTVAAVAVGYYEFQGLDSIRPYLSAGAGFAVVNANNLTVAGQPGTISGTSVVPVVRVGAGLNVQVAENLDLFADYTLMAGTSATFDYNVPGFGFVRNVSGQVLGHVLSVGLRGHF
jgi:opacity protein-like surface antigen